MNYQKIALVVVGCASIYAVKARADHWALEAKEAIVHTFTKDTVIDVDNINGTIEVIGDNGKDMRVEGEKIIEADNKENLDRGRKEVTLDMNEKDGVAQLYVNGPFRHHDDHATDSHAFHERYDSWRHYQVRYNIIVHVPRQTELRLRNLNGGIRTEQTAGKFEIHGTNGPIVMAAVSGSGTARTVNGPLTATFLENPKAPSDFQTVNGKIDATFMPNLSANINVKTVNGGAFTDFEGTSLASQPMTPDTRNGTRIYRRDKATHLRIGAGGPELNFQTVNGSINIRKGSVSGGTAK
jgi:DUF4097 and DUF4098 domain-containing protein YvlB